MYFYNPSERGTKELAPGINARTFWGENMLVSVVDLEPDKPLPEHSHPHEQVGTILAGSVDFTIGGETRTLRVGEVFIIPGDVPHSAVTGPQGAKVMEVFSPVREDLKY
jgi:unsaturated pyranuronate lyase